MERPAESVATKQYVTVKQAAWRTAPSAMGYRIDLLPGGWQVSEVPWSQTAHMPVEGWLPIAPRGFVQRNDVVEASEEDLATFLSPPQAQGSPLGLASPPQVEKLTDQSSSVANTRHALLALREEHVRLREANLKLRERELSKKQEIDSLDQQSGKAAQRLATVHEELATAEKELDLSQEKQRALLKRLALCREAISTAVKSVDAIYDRLSEEEDKPQVTKTPDAQVQSLVSNAVNADEAIAHLSALLEGSESAEPKALEDNYSRGAENAKICGNEKSLDKETSPYERAPLRDLNVGLA